jgi:hypothetical protein
MGRDATAAGRCAAQDWQPPAGWTSEEARAPSGSGAAAPAGAPRQNGADQRAEGHPTGEAGGAHHARGAAPGAASGAPGGLPGPPGGVPSGLPGALLGLPGGLPDGAPPASGGGGQPGPGGAAPGGPAARGVEGATGGAARDLGLPAGLDLASLGALVSSLGIPLSQAAAAPAAGHGAGHLMLFVEHALRTARQEHRGWAAARAA